MVSLSLLKASFSWVGGDTTLTSSGGGAGLSAISGEVNHRKQPIRMKPVCMLTIFCLAFPVSYMDDGAAIAIMAGD